MSKQVVIQQAPAQLANNTPNFFQEEFEKLIWDKGYRVIHEKALTCPCKSKAVNQLSNCKNCGGTGWLFINPTETRMILHNMNQSTEYKAWSQENLGNVSISVINSDRLTYMDRITLIESEADFNEERHFKKSIDNVLFTYLSYHAKSIKYVGLFIDENTLLTRLDSTQYSIDGNKLFLDASFLADYSEDFPYTVTVSYIHQPQFHILDINRQVMNSRSKLYGKESIQDMPIAAVGRRAHFVLDTQNINHTRLLDNSYLDADCKTNIKIVDSYSKMC